MLLPIRWCKDEVTESERSQKPFLTASRNTELVPSTQQLSTMTDMNLFQIDNIQENKFQKRIEKKVRFNKAMSLAKQAIALQDNDENDHELEVFLQNYVDKKKFELEKETQQRELRIFKERQNSNVLSTQIDGHAVSIENIADLAYHVGKGEPRKKHIKGKQEKFQAKKKSTLKPRICRFCHEPNHYQSTCPLKRSRENTTQ
ncbi:hypothetical protein C2G38_2314468 [Gigaspora rosea]|uniref:CCHC-type domain-containing protein n=1 Tax=Gigaspora rosea TaxID=44941 RepID=A0A397W1H2_9GLOM|nr:hypothetical protein C2G38_2314468 [Gigaspora rosea]